MLKLINGTKKAPRFTDSQKTECHLRMFQSGMDEYYKTQSRWALTKAVYNGVRLMNLNYQALKDAEFVPIDVWSMGLKNYKSLEAIMALMTPEEIIRTFPITKTYDGKRWECADYFSTLEKFDGLKKNRSLFVQFKEPFDILFGYQNPHILRFVTNMMCTVDKLRRADGKDDMLTSFCKEQGINPPHKMTMHNDNGKQYMIDENGKSMPLRKAKPRYLKVLK